MSGSMAITSNIIKDIKRLELNSSLFLYVRNDYKLGQSYRPKM